MDKSNEIRNQLLKDFQEWVSGKGYEKLYNYLTEELNYTDKEAKEIIKLYEKE